MPARYYSQASELSHRNVEEKSNRSWNTQRTYRVTDSTTGVVSRSPPIDRPRFNFSASISTLLVERVSL